MTVQEMPADSLLMDDVFEDYATRLCEVHLRIDGILEHHQGLKPTTPCIPIYATGEMAPLQQALAGGQMFHHLAHIAHGIMGQLHGLLFEGMRASVATGTVPAEWEKPMVTLHQLMRQMRTITSQLDDLACRPFDISSSRNPILNRS
jgi:hypothetical protein